MACLIIPSTGGDRLTKLFHLQGENDVTSRANLASPDHESKK